MKNLNLANKINELRIRNGLSQESLAIKAQLSLRTIQRIEGGETEPRGDTLNRLASALNSTIGELTGLVKYENNEWLAVLNLSALSFILFPLLGLIVPLVIYVLKRNRIKDIEENVKPLLNFQISWIILTGIIYSAFFINIPLPHIPFIGRPEFIMLNIAILYWLNIVFILVNTFRSVKGRKPFYKPALRFMR
jgi:transcriptional regulator with XRE-family HTH domain